MKDKLQALDADLKTEADAYNVIQKGMLHERHAAAAVLGTVYGRCICCAFRLRPDRRCCVDYADINKNGDARRKFTQQLQENEMVLQAKRLPWRLLQLQAFSTAPCALVCVGTGPQPRHLCSPAASLTF
jgi:hypothetical protein